MTDYAWSADLAPAAMSFYLQPHVGRSESPFTRQQKVYGLSAPRWLARASFRGGYDGASGIEAWGGRLDSTIALLAGGLNRITFWDFRRPTRTGAGGDLQDASFLGVTFGFTDATLFDDGFGFVTSWTGPPLSLAAAAGATTMRWTGFTVGTYPFNAGDYVGGDGRAHLITVAPIVAGDGSVTVTFTPPLNASVAAGAGIYTEVSSLFRLASDDAGANMAEVGGLTVYDFELVEDL